MTSIDPKFINDYVEENANRLQHNYELIDIFEGNLLKYLLRILKKTINKKTYAQMQDRISPINMLPKIIDKQTNIYQTGVIREIVNGTENDQTLLDWYQLNQRTDVYFNCSNELFNLCDYALVQPYVYQSPNAEGLLLPGIPKVRVILNDCFLPYSDDLRDPTKMTMLIVDRSKEAGRRSWYVYTDSQIVIVNDKKQIDAQAMAEESMLGDNPIGKIPFTYINSSLYRLIPKIETDLMQMILTPPVMLSDLNTAAKFQCFSLVYGINIQDEERTIAPNVFWNLKGDTATDQKPEIGTIKPEVDYDQVLNLIQSQFSLWLSSKGIRPGAVGQLTEQNFLSGISKMIDEMDTFESRQKQVEDYKQAEHDFWNLIMHHLHPYWVDNGMIEEIGKFSEKAHVNTIFKKQEPLMSRTEMINEVKSELDAGITSKKRAIKRVNPDMTDEAVEELLKEIDAEKALNGERRNTDIDQGAGLPNA